MGFGPKVETREPFTKIADVDTQDAAVKLELFEDNMQQGKPTLRVSVDLPPEDPESSARQVSIHGLGSGLFTELRAIAINHGEGVAERVARAFIVGLAKQMGSGYTVTLTPLTQTR